MYVRLLPTHSVLRPMQPARSSDSAHGRPCHAVTPSCACPPCACASCPKSSHSSLRANSLRERVWIQVRHGATPCCDEVDVIARSIAVGDDGNEDLLPEHPAKDDLGGEARAEAAVTRQRLLNLSLEHAALAGRLVATLLGFLPRHDVSKYATAVFLHHGAVELPPLWLRARGAGEGGGGRAKRRAPGQTREEIAKEAREAEGPTARLARSSRRGRERPWDCSSSTWGAVRS
jgi:hypothetical protein